MALRGSRSQARAAPTAHVTGMEVEVEGECVSLCVCVCVYGRLEEKGGAENSDQ